MKIVIGLLLITLLINCGATSKKPTSIELITDAGQQDSLFQSLIMIARNNVPENIKKDSLAFLILPVQASCPSCREKTIDSIVKHKNNLLENHFIIISASGGYKTINSYFKEQNAVLSSFPVLILDSTNLANEYNLFKDNPTIYYTANQKAYKKVLSIPATVKDDLREFFSGYRTEIKKANEK